MACPAAAATYVNVCARPTRRACSAGPVSRLGAQRAVCDFSPNLRSQRAFLRARVGAGRGPCMWSSVLVGCASPRAARDTRARASELQQQAARPAGGAVASHKVTVHDRQRGVVHEFVVPEDQYILHTAEAQDIRLPFACRHGCCTSCAVRIRSGQIRQPEALGISAELKDQGFALLCWFPHW